MNSPIGAMGLGKESIWNGTDKNSEVTAGLIAMLDSSADLISPASTHVRDLLSLVNLPTKFLNLDCIIIS